LRSKLSRAAAVVATIYSVKQQNQIAVQTRRREAASCGTGSYRHGLRDAVATNLRSKLSRAAAVVATIYSVKQQNQIAVQTRRREAASCGTGSYRHGLRDAVATNLRSKLSRSGAAVATTTTQNKKTSYGEGNHRDRNAIMTITTSTTRMISSINKTQRNQLWAAI
jgi:ribosomal protein S27AE